MNTIRRSSENHTRQKLFGLTTNVDQKSKPSHLPWRGKRLNIAEETFIGLRQAAQLKEQIAKLQGELNRLAGAPAVKPVVVKAVSPAPKKKGGMSAAGKARIVAAQKARWAKIKAAKVVAPAVKPAKPAKKKFVMSAAAKAKISAAAKARWAKIKAAKK